METQHYFGDWTIEEELGQGAFGKVYKIHKEEFNVSYYSAMKVIRIPVDKSENKRLYSLGMDSLSIDDYYSQFARDFVKEIELMAKLQGNTNIVGYNDHKIVKNEDGIGYTIYIRMEYLTPLDSYLVKDGRPRFMTQKEVVKLGIDICNALEICSKKNIIHRDVKPGNIFISENGDFKLGDFGIARRLEKTQSGLSRKGTINYMAPEVYMGGEYNQTVDVYSLALVLYSLLNKNRFPFVPPYPQQLKYTDNEAAFARRIKGEAIPPIDGVCDELNAVILKACAFEPGDRYESAAQMKEALINVRPLLKDEPADDDNGTDVLVPPVDIDDDKDTDVLDAPVDIGDDNSTELLDDNGTDVLAPPIDIDGKEGTEVLDDEKGTEVLDDIERTTVLGTIGEEELTGEKTLFGPCGPPSNLSEIEKHVEQAPDFKPAEIEVFAKEPQGGNNKTKKIVLAVAALVIVALCVALIASRAAKNRMSDAGEALTTAVTEMTTAETTVATTAPTTQAPVKVDVKIILPSVINEDGNYVSDTVVLAVNGEAVKKEKVKLDGSKKTWTVKCTGKTDVKVKLRNTCDPVTKTAGGTQDENLKFDFSKYSKNRTTTTSPPATQRRSSSYTQRQTTNSSYDEHF